MPTPPMRKGVMGWREVKRRVSLTTLKVAQLSKYTRGVKMAGEANAPAK